MNQKQLYHNPSFQSQPPLNHSTSSKQIHPQASSSFNFSDSSSQHGKSFATTNHSSLANFPESNNTQGTRPKLKIFDPLVSNKVTLMPNIPLFERNSPKSPNKSFNNTTRIQGNTRPNNIHFVGGVQQNHQLGPSLKPKSRISEDSSAIPKIYQTPNNFQQEQLYQQTLNNYPNYPNYPIPNSNPNPNHYQYQYQPQAPQVFSNGNYNGNLAPFHPQNSGINSFQNTNYNSQTPMTQTNQFPFYFDLATHPDLDTSYTSTATHTTSRRRIKPIVVMNINIGQGQKAEIQVFEGDNPSDVAANFCQSYNLPPSLIQVLTENIMTQVNNYYQLKSQKAQKSSMPPVFLHKDSSRKNFETFVQEDFQQPEFVQEFDEREHPEQLLMSEKASIYEPVPHDYTPNPALKQSIQNDYEFQNTLRHERRLHTTQDDEYYSPEKENNRRRSFDNNERSSPEILPKKKGRSKTPTQTQYQRNDDQDENYDSNGNGYDANELDEIEEEIKKLKMKKQQLYNDKYKSSRTEEYPSENGKKQNNVKASIKDFETYHMESLHDYNQISPNHKANQINQHHESFQGRIDNPGNSQSPMRKTPTKSYLTQIADEQRNKNPYRDLVMQEMQKKREFEEQQTLSNEKRNFSPQFYDPENNNNNNSHPSMTQTQVSTTPYNSDTKGNGSSRKNKGEYQKQAPGSQNPVNNSKGSKRSFYEENNSRSSIRSNPSSRGNHTGSMIDAPHYVEMKNRILAEIFGTLDDDDDGEISIEKVDVTQLDPEILNNLSEIFDALQDDMVLNFTDFINIVNHKRLVEAYHKVNKPRPEFGGGNLNSENDIRM